MNDYLLSLVHLYLILLELTLSVISSSPFLHNGHTILLAFISECVKTTKVTILVNMHRCVVKYTVHFLYLKKHKTISLQGLLPLKNKLKIHRINPLNAC